MSMTIDFKTHQALMETVKAQEYARGMLDMRKKLEAAGIIPDSVTEQLTTDLFTAIAGSPRASLFAMLDAVRILLPEAGVAIPAEATKLLDALTAAVSR